LGGKVLQEWSVSDGKGSWLTPDVTFSYPEIKKTRRNHLLVPAYLVVEIRSMDQNLKDLFNKREAYRRWGIPHYWLIDPVESACYECLPVITPCAEKLTADRIEVAVSEIFS
jgi:Uma2 family endonuclease